MDGSPVRDMVNDQPTVTVSEETAKEYTQSAKTADVDSVIREFEKDPFELADELSSKTE